MAKPQKPKTCEKCQRKPYPGMKFCRNHCLGQLRVMLAEGYLVPLQYQSSSGLQIASPRQFLTWPEEMPEVSETSF